MMMLTRNLTQSFLDSLTDTPVLLVNGSRQSGKSTFIKMLLDKTHTYYTLDDPTILSIAYKDPLMFLENLTSPSMIDEIQRALSLFLPLKKVIDQQRKPGFFVLTGSANVLALPHLADSLAGRLEIHTLWPLSQGELRSIQEDFISFIFNAPSLSSSHFKHPLFSLDNLVDGLIQGGYPEIIQRPLFQRRKKWFASYLQAIIEKDIRSLSAIEGLIDIPNLLQLCATRCGSIFNISELSRTIGIPATTLKRYLALLQQTYLLIFVPAWTKNLSKRLVKTPKIYLNDTGLLTHILDYDKQRLFNDKSFLGHVLENFVMMELKKQMGWSQQACRLYHYRTHTHQEIDFILEASDGRIVALEVKLASSVTPKDFIALHNLEADIGSSFHRGIVFYMGDLVIPFGPNKYAIPLPWLWNHPQ